MGGLSERLALSQLLVGVFESVLVGRPVAVKPSRFLWNLQF